MRALTLAILLVLATPAAQAPTVVAESRAEGQWGVAALQARLAADRRYVLQIDGPPGAPFTAYYMQVYVGRPASGGASGNDDGTFDGVVPYEQELVPPAANLLFWRYSAVISPTEPAELTARILDLGPR